MKKLLAIVLAAVLVLSAFAGCGKQTDTTAPNAENKEQTGTQSTTSDGGSLVIWVEKSFSEDVDKLFDERIQAFGQEKGVKVKAEFISATDYMTKLNAAVEAGNVPDLTLVNPYKVVSYYPGNPFSDVTDLVEEIDGQRPMFDALNAAVAISDPDNGFYGLGMGCGPTDEDCENSFRMMMWDMGGSLMDKDGKIVADSNAGLSAMIDKYVELYEAGAIPPAAITWDSGGNNKTYLMGESAMVINVPTLYNAIRNDEQYAELLENTLVLNLPAGSADNAVFGNPSGWAIMKDAKNSENAREFIKFISEKEWYDTYMDSIAPVFAPVYQDLVGSETWGSGVNKQAIEYIQNAVGYYGYPCETLEGRAIASKNYYSFPIARMLNSIVTGSATKDQAIAQLQKELQDTASVVTGG